MLSELKESLVSAYGFPPRFGPTSLSSLIDWFTKKTMNFPFLIDIHFTGNFSSFLTLAGTKLEKVSFPGLSPPDSGLVSLPRKPFSLRPQEYREPSSVSRKDESS